MSAEPSLRWRIERRWRVPPPAPYTNDWELTASYHSEIVALTDAAEDRAENPAWEYRVVDRDAGEQKKAA